MNIKERVEALRNLMKERNIDAYIVPSGDPHQSEYVAEHYAEREYITGFTGSAGTAVITLNGAGLWTDGRYFIQAERQLNDTGVTLFKMGEPGIPTIEKFLNKSLEKKSTIGFDGKVISVDYFRNLNKSLKIKDFSFKVDEDLIDLVWNDRPAKPSTQVILHDVKYAGKTREEKIAQVIEKMKNLNANYYVISSLDDIAWLFNIRGRDVSCNPVSIAYAIVSENKTCLFIDDCKLNDEVKKELKKDNVEIKAYEDIISSLSDIKEGTILFDSSKTNVLVHSSIKVETVECMDITTRLKAMKNEVEVANVRTTMVRDGVAMVKFVNWFKKTIKEKTMTEIEVSDKLEEFRRQGDNFVDLSFGTISAYKANASMPHYSATPENQATIEAKSLYLVDSGAQYFDGTTDITRTIAAGPLTDEERTDFTLVLKGMIDLTMQRFLYGATGSSLDILARIPLWNAGLDFKHGTGHGVGFFLNVHEGPHRISPAPNNIKLEQGMIVSNEPGVYKEGKHGIRIENLVVVQKDERTQYAGQFMKFETLTLCPIDLEAIDVSLLNEAEKNWLNDYHKTVFEKLSPYLEKDDKDFLKEATKAI
ncbi:aminopeptidase P family protein [Clostridium frigidicarnis]|uniref:Xaa-Pro aminopeptidase n=1 Tax=Clostridium frigidicarnis TaxID=84698 RepID=A0A1I0WYK4_9CLOT|nr:aminopeptidase P family protein [Clostridium frigidicarnis]SFA93487.1 Xaa-Pro aminopeptidase [Clostridium frigidicarnis]